MKLLHYTNTKLSTLLLALIGVWGVFFFFAIHYEIRDETDDMLRSYSDIFIKKALQNPALLQSSYETTFDRYAIRPISNEEAAAYDEEWLNTTLYFPEGDEHIPVRVYKSIFLAPDDHYYELEISMSTLERDDMVKTLFIYLLALYVLLLLCSIVGNRLLLKRSFRPLQQLLVWLDSIVPGKPIPAQRIDTSIEEFRQLNEATMAMSRRNLEAYEQQKQFIENASHELQTPLAVALNRLEMLAQCEGTTEKQLAEIDDIYRTLNRTVKLNKSLLLLSRIDNHQYQDVAEVDLTALVDDLAADFEEIYADKDVRMEVHRQAGLTVRMNENLSRVLVSNLLKNAYVHTSPGGRIDVTIAPRRLVVHNEGDRPLDGTRIFDRFYYSSEQAKGSSTGLGLAIVKSICGLYGIEVHYAFRNGHEFVLDFPEAGVRG